MHKAAWYLERQNGLLYLLRKPPAASNDNNERHVGNPEVLARIKDENVASVLLAAPEVLGALEIALGDVLYLAKETGQLARFQETIDLCSAAIAKATGGAS